MPAEHQFIDFYRCPKYAQEIFDGLRLNPEKTTSTFCDRYGRWVQAPANNKDREYCPTGYAVAMWDFKDDSMIIGEDGETLYVRDIDTAENGFQRLDSWHIVNSIEAEYKVSGREAYPEWNTLFKIETRKLPARMHHGIKFTNCVFYRNTEGKIIKTSDQDILNQPFDLTLDVAYDETLVKQAIGYLSDITNEANSAQNLARMFATPLLDAYKHLTYIMYGDGGNGKGIILSSLKKTFGKLTASVDSQKMLGGRSGSGGFGTDQEMLKLDGALWACDEEANIITLEQMTSLKKISTGEPVVARRIQENAVTIIPQATFVLATNNPVITTMTAASERRFVYIRMRDHRKAEEFQELLNFINEYGATPFIMASCAIWYWHGDTPHTGISIGDVDDLGDAEQWIVDQICDKGYAISKENPYHETRSEHMNTVAKLGLQSDRRYLDGNQVRVLIIKDEKRFAPYRGKPRKARFIPRHMLNSKEDINMPIEHEGKPSINTQAGSTPTPEDNEEYVVYAGVRMLKQHAELYKHNSNTYDDDTEFDVSPIPGIHKQGGELDKTLKRIEVSHSEDTIDIFPISPVDEETLPKDTNLLQSLTTYEDNPPQPPDQLANIPVDETPSFDETSVPPENEER